MKKKIYIGSIFLFILDQITKFLMIDFLDYGKSVNVIPNFFSFTLLKNTGGAFSILTGNVLLLSIIGIIILGYGIYYIEKIYDNNKLEGVSISLILGGLIGNLTDRILRGGVIDFLSFNIFGYSYPVFNLADMFLVVGVILYIYQEVRHKK